MLAIGSKHKAKKVSGAAEHVTMGGGTSFICCRMDGEKRHSENTFNQGVSSEAWL